MASPTKVEQSTEAARGVTLVFVLASSGTPLMPCHPARARQFLKEGRARIHKLLPFTIRLVDRSGGVIQPILLKIDPGATTTGFALNRAAKEDSTIQTTLHLAELTHRGDDIRARNKKRAATAADGAIAICGIARHGLKIVAGHQAGSPSA